MGASATSSARVLGRYTLYDPIASGGMATVHFGRLLGPVGFARTVAIKRLHPQFARDPEFVSMFLDEARLAARIGHPNVVPTLDVVALDGELFLVMEYVQGESLGSLLKALRTQGQRMRVSYAVAIVAGALRGLHAAHEATDERGGALGIVHRDISPQNILVGVDGVPRVLDFGVAKAAGRLQATREGQLKGKMAYMSPEQIRSAGTDRRTDIYAAGAVLWEALTGQKLFQADNDVAMLAKVLERKFDPPSAFSTQVSPPLDDIVMQALAMSPDDRFQTARDMARALERVVPLVAAAEIGEWVETVGAGPLTTRAQTVSRIESDSSTQFDAVPPPSSMSNPTGHAQSARSSESSAPNEPAERTEVSEASDLHSAVVVARSHSRKMMLVAGASGAAVLIVVALLWAVMRPGAPTAAIAASVAVVPSERSVSPPPTPSTAVAPSSAPLPIAPPSTAATTRGAAPLTPSTDTKTVATAPPLTPQAAAPPIAPTPGAPTATHPRPPQPAKPHGLDGVLDSRK